MTFEVFQLRLYFFPFLVIYILWSFRAIRLVCHIELDLNLFRIGSPIPLVI